MAAVGLAIIGKNNAPLYVREFLSEHETKDGEDEAILFGLRPLSGGSSGGSSSSVTPSASNKCWFALHAALDRLDQLTRTLDGRKKTTPTNDSFVGLVIPCEESRVYGYVTNTHTKFLLIVEDEGPNEAEATESDMKKLLEEIHDLYVREVMNPFSSGGTKNNISKISNANKFSQKFDEHIQKHITNFNQPEIRYSLGVAEC